MVVTLTNYCNSFKFNLIFNSIFNPYLKQWMYNVHVRNAWIIYSLIYQGGLVIFIHITQKCHFFPYFSSISTISGTSRNAEMAGLPETKILKTIFLCLDDLLEILDFILFCCLILPFSIFNFISMKHTIQMFK